MDLDFSNKGLLSFDASRLSKGLGNDSSFSHDTDDVLAKLLERAPPIRAVNLSRNVIQRFIGGECLRTVTVLNLAYNALTTLSGASLPPALVKLNLSHNHLKRLDSFASNLTRLEELNVGHNNLTSVAVRGLPMTLTSLNLQDNELEDLEALRPLSRLTKLTVSCNKLERREVIIELTHLRCLRYLDIRGNPLLTTSDDLYGSIVNLLPRLSHYNGDPLSQAESNSMYKATSGRSASQLSQKQFKSDLSHSCSSNASALRAASLIHSPILPSGRLRQQKKQERVGQSCVGIQLMEAKVDEFRRLACEAHKAERQAFSERALLIEQVKACAKVIEDQAVVLNQLQKRIGVLKHEEQKLKKPILELDRIFKQTHASLLEHKINDLSNV